MLKLERIKLNKIQNIFKKLPKNLAQNPFLAFLGFLTLALMLGAIIFYQYSILADRKIPEITEQPLKFQEKTYQTILTEWQKRSQNLLGIDTEEYSNPF